jgi:hypothetical protein
MNNMKSSDHAWGREGGKTGSASNGQHCCKCVTSGKKLSIGSRFSVLLEVQATANIASNV